MENSLKSVINAIGDGRMKNNFSRDGKIAIEIKRLEEISDIFGFPMCLFMTPKLPKNIKKILEKEREKKRRELELRDCMRKFIEEEIRWLEERIKELKSLYDKYERQFY